jgi:Tfp pilus assembly protein PilF
VAKKTPEASQRIVEAALGKNHPNNSYVLENLGLRHADRGQFEQAEALLRRS